MLIFFSLACVLNRTHQSVYSAMQQDVQALASDIDQLEREFDTMSTRLSDIEELTRSRGQSEILTMDSTDQIRMELANLRNDLELLKFDYQKTESLAEGTSTDSNYRLTWLESRAQQLESELGLSPTTPPTSEQASGVEGDASIKSPEDKKPEDKEPTESLADLTPEELMDKAETHLKAGRARAAEAILQQFIDKHNDHNRYAEALYRYAEAAFHSGDYIKAAKRYQAVIEHNKKGPWASYAMLFQGDCFRESGKEKHAKVFYNAVIEDYPNSKAAKEAKSRLKD